MDIIGLVLPLIRGQNVVETSRRHRASRFELLSPSKGHGLTKRKNDRNLERGKMRLSEMWGGAKCLSIILIFQIPPDLVVKFQIVDIVEVM
jgi:hypothetical protein